MATQAILYGKDGIQDVSYFCFVGIASDRICFMEGSGEFLFYRCVFDSDFPSGNAEGPAVSRTGELPAIFFKG
jgi:hypothetical protein